MPKVKKAAPPAAEKWSHDFLFLRSADKEGKSYGGFQWPLEAGGEVVAPDWNPEPVCGGGLQGLADGIGDWGLMAAPRSSEAIWYVCGAVRAAAVAIDGQKIKVPRCTVLYVGSLARAMELIAPAMSTAMLALVEARTAAATLEQGSQATGERGAASATGWSGAASATGVSGAASATGVACVALAAGFEARGMVGPGCLLVLVERDETGAIVGRFCALAGERDVEPGKWYTLRGGALTEVA